MGISVVLEVNPFTVYNPGGKMEGLRLFYRCTIRCGGHAG
jgi:hypothetical protein